MDTDSTASQSPATDLAEDWRYAERHDLMCRVELSAAYHGKRERFLLTCERVSQAIAALTATAAFSQLFTPAAGTTGGPMSNAGAWLALAAAMASIGPLVFAWASRSNKHSNLAADHKRLMAEVTAAGYDLSESQLAAFRSKLHLIEASEHASLGALVVQCQNEMAAARGDVSSIVPLKWYQRLLMHVVDWDVQPPSKSTTLSA